MCANPAFVPGMVDDAALDHLDVGAGIKQPGSELLHIAREAEDAVRIRTGQVGVEP